MEYMDNFDVFISYCRIDSTVAKQITHKLKEFGLNCFLDVDKLQLGSSYAHTLQSAILESKYVIYIYGENTEDNIWQRRELDLSLESGKKVISLFVNHSNEGFIHSILKKKTICHTSINDVCNLIQKGIVHITEKDNIPIPSTIKQRCNYKSSKPRKKRCILLGVITLILIFISFLLYNISSPRIVEVSLESNDPSQSLDITDSTSVSEVFDIGTDGENEDCKEKTKVTTIVQSSAWWEYWIWTNRCWAALIGFLFGIIVMFIIKVPPPPKKKKNLKLSCDVDASVSIDGSHVAKINAGDVFSTHLVKGEYLIDFKSNENEHNRIIQKIADKDMHVVFSEFLNKEEKKFKCFIAGSLSLSTERNALIATISKMGNRWESEKFRISSYTFEDFNRDVVPGGQQMLYDKFIETEADWCVFIISNGIGEKTLNEYSVAMNSLKNYGHPKILFLASAEPTKDETLSVIKKEITGANQYWNTCNNIEHMQSILRDCLEWDVTLLSKSLVSNKNGRVNN